MSTPIRNRDEFERLWDQTPAARLGVQKKTTRAEFDSLWGATAEPTEPPSSFEVEKKEPGFFQRIRERFRRPVDAERVGELADLTTGTPSPRVLAEQRQAELEADIARAGAPVPDRGFFQEFGAGFAGATRGQYRTALGTALEAAAGVTGSEPMREEGREFVERGELALAARRPRVGRLEEIKSVEDAVDWLAYAAGQGVGSTLAPIIGGIGGGAAGTALAGPVGGLAGSLAGAAAPGYALNYSELRRALEEEGVTGDRLERWAAIGALPMAALDLVGVERLIGPVVKGTKREIARGLARRIVREGAVQAGIEGMTEGAQEAVKAAVVAGTTPEEFWTPEVLTEVLNAAAAGAPAGFLFGAAAAPGTTARPEGEAPAGRRPLRRRVAEALDPTLADELARVTEERDVAEQERRTAERARLVDSLTGVANREALDRALPAAEADEETVVVVFDANNFGQVNKQVSQEAGDEMIQDVAGAITQAADLFGVSERVFRRGGDEFVVLAPADVAADLRDRAEQIFGERTAGDVTVSLSGTVGATFSEADAALQARKQERKYGLPPEPVPPTEAEAALDEAFGPGAEVVPPPRPPEIDEFLEEAFEPEAVEEPATEPEETRPRAEALEPVEEGTPLGEEVDEATRQRPTPEQLSTPAETTLRRIEQMQDGDAVVIQFRDAEEPLRLEKRGDEWIDENGDEYDTRFIRNTLAMEDASVQLERRRTPGQRDLFTPLGEELEEAERREEPTPEPERLEQPSMRDLVEAAGGDRDLARDALNAGAESDSPSFFALGRLDGLRGRERRADLPGPYQDGYASIEAEPPAAPTEEGVPEEAGPSEFQEEGPEGDVYGSPERWPTSARTVRPPDPVTGEAARLPKIGPELTGELETRPGRRLVPAKTAIEAIARITEAAGKAIPFRVGRLATRRTRGEFKVQPEVIRTKQADDIPTAAHEAAHALEKLVYGTPKRGPWKKPIADGTMQRELAALGRDLYSDRRPAGGYKREGFAEFVRLWLTTEGDAEAKAPRFGKWFRETFLPEYPAVHRAIEEARKEITAFRMQGSQARAKTAVVDPAAPGTRLRRAWATVRRLVSKEKLFEQAQPLHDLAREAERILGRELRPSEDPFFTTSALRTTHAARTKQMVTDAMIDLAGNRVGPALEDVQPLVKGKQKEFTIYLWARRAVALWLDPKRGPRNPGLSLEDARQIIQELETPQFQLAASKVYEWNDGVLNYAAQASPIFAEAVGRVRDVDPGSYIPLQRVFDELDDIWQRSGRSRAASRKSPVQRLKGSGRRIKDPFQAMIAQAEATVRAAHERMVLDQIVRLAQLEGMGNLIEEVPRDQLPAYAATVGDLLERVERELQKEGLSVDLFGAEGLPSGIEGAHLLGTMVTFFKPADVPKGKDPIIPIHTKTGLRWYYVDRTMFDALSSLDVYRLPDVAGMPIADWLFGKPARVFRAGTTGLRASFGLVWNMIRDPQTLWVNSQASANGGRLFLGWIKAMQSAFLYRTTGIRDNPYLDAFLRWGGEMAQPLGQDIPHTRRAARRLFEGRVVRTLDVRNWFDFYRDLIQAPELAPRAAEVEAVAKDIGWNPGEPITLDQSMRLLLAGKQVTTDFTAFGEFTRVMNQIVPFFNAAVQGPRANLRALRRDPRKFVSRGLQLSAVTFLLWWTYKDEDWWKELPYREKFLNWHFPFRNPFTDEEELIRLPRAFEVGLIFAALPEAFLDAWYHEDPEAVQEWFETFRKVANPMGLPVLFEEALEQAANRDFFWDRPIVPLGEQRKPAEEQFNEWTSVLAIVLGDIFDVSPRRIDHAIEGMFGPVGGDVLHILGLGPQASRQRDELADAPILGRLFQRGGTTLTRPKSVDRLYEVLEEAQIRQASDRHKETEAERQQRLQLNDASRAISALLYVRRFARSKDAERRLTRAAIRIAREALRMQEQGTIDREVFQDYRREFEDLKEAVKP